MVSGKPITRCIEPVTQAHELIGAACSDEVPVSADIRPIEEFVEDEPYISPTIPARPARVEPNSFRCEVSHSLIAFTCCCWAL